MVPGLGFRAQGFKCFFFFVWGGYGLGFRVHGLRFGGGGMV